MNLASAADVVGGAENRPGRLLLSGWLSVSLELDISRCTSAAKEEAPDSLLRMEALLLVIDAVSGVRLLS